MGLSFGERRGPAWKQRLVRANSRLQMQQSMMLLKMFLLILPVLLILAAQLTWSLRSRTRWRSDDIVSKVPWSVMVLLVMVSFHCQIQSIRTPSVQSRD